MRKRSFLGALASAPFATRWKGLVELSGAQVE